MVCCDCDCPYLAHTSPPAQTDNAWVFFLASLKRETYFGEKKVYIQAGACCQSFFLLFYYTEMFWCHRLYKKRLKAQFYPPISPTPAQVIEHRSSMQLFTDLPKEWKSYYLNWQMFSSFLNSWKFNRLGCVEVYTVMKGHGDAVPRRNIISSLVSYSCKLECLFGAFAEMRPYI